jgi:hypothetical protein
VCPGHSALADPKRTTVHWEKTERRRPKMPPTLVFFLKMKCSFISMYYQFRLIDCFHWVQKRYELLASHLQTWCPSFQNLLGTRT